MTESPFSAAVNPEAQLSLISALARSYETVFLVNAETGEAFNYCMNSDMERRYGEVFVMGDYESSIDLYIERDVLEVDRPLFDTVRTVEGVRSLLSHAPDYTFQYRVQREGELHHFQARFVMATSKRTELVVGFTNIDEMVAREQESLQLQREQVRIIDALSREYHSLFKIEAATGRISLYRTDGAGMPPALIDQLLEGGDYEVVIERYVDAFVAEEDRPRIMEIATMESLMQHVPDVGLYKLGYRRSRAGDNRFYEMNLAKTVDEDGAVIFIMGMRDANEQMQLVRDAFDIAEAANRAKTDFLSSMSHDIRTPMNGIIGMTAIAAAHLDDPERVADCLAKITQASKHMLGLINEVLDMSKIESGAVELIEEDFNLSQLVDSLLSITGQQIEEHGHELSVSIADVRHEDVVGDSLRIQKIFTNLMSNAVKYTPDGGKISLSIAELPSSQPRVGRYEFAFEDNGIGMSPEFLERVFEPFSRANDPHAGNVQGTGLGMAISRNIARMMGGDIEVQSTLGEGSRVTVTICLKLQEHEELDAERFVDLGVLVADDDPLAVESCCGMLAGLGMRPEGVASGREALESVVAHHEAGSDFFACILDWKMPGMSGIETTRAIRAAVGEDVPIIIISAYDWSEIEQEARAAGANAFISKPLFRSRLARTFQGLVGGEPAPEPTGAPTLGDLESLDLAGKRALLVEDNELNAEIAAEILRAAGLAVEWAADGTEAVDMMAAAEDGRYDIVFMDVRMPRMGGYDATRAIRAMERRYCREVPIVAMTANAFAEDVLAAKTAGMNGHIAKPLDLGVLATTLKRWLG